MQSSLPPASEPHEPSPRPQFGLRMIFIVVTAICGLLALARLVSPFVLGILVLVMITVGAHLAASGMGHRLRQTAHRRRHRSRAGAGPDTPGVTDEHPAEGILPTDLAPSTRLSRRQSLGRIVIIAPLVGGLVGATCGGFGMAKVLGPQSNWANLGVVAIAAGVLGGIGSFLLATFLKAFWDAHAEAWRHEVQNRN